LHKYSEKFIMSLSSTPHQPAIAVALPQRPKSSEDYDQANKRPPVWSLGQSSVANAPEVPLPAKCNKHDQPGGICCKELKDDNERHLVDPDIVRDMYVLFFWCIKGVCDLLTLIWKLSVIGLSDGLTVPFALTAGLSSLGESRLVVLGGVAELIAGAISMGIGGFRESCYL
jgi:vacuolar iron transporter family protein